MNGEDIDIWTICRQNEEIDEDVFPLNVKLGTDRVMKFDFDRPHTNVIYGVKIE